MLNVYFIEHFFIFKNGQLRACGTGIDAKDFVDIFHIGIFPFLQWSDGSRVAGVADDAARPINQTASKPVLIAKTLASLNLAFPLSANILHMACST